MIAEKATECIEQAILYELQNIIKNYGATYASEHEAYAILLEEVEESEEALDGVKNYLNCLWTSIRNNSVSDFDLHQLKEFALALAEESVQVAAVCERFEETIKKGK